MPSVVLLALKCWSVVKYIIIITIKIIIIVVIIVVVVVIVIGFIKSLIQLTPDNSNPRKLELPLTRTPIFVSPQLIFYIILPSITRTMFWALKKSGKKPSTGVRNIEFWISYWRVVGV